MFNSKKHDRNLQQKQVKAHLEIPTLLVYMDAKWSDPTVSSLPQAFNWNKPNFRILRKIQKKKLYCVVAEPPFLCDFSV